MCIVASAFTNVAFVCVVLTRQSQLLVMKKQPVCFSFKIWGASKKTWVGQWKPLRTSRMSLYLQIGM